MGRDAGGSQSDSHGQNLILGHVGMDGQAAKDGSQRFAVDTERGAYQTLGLATEPHAGGCGDRWA